MVQIPLYIDGQVNIYHYVYMVSEIVNIISELFSIKLIN